MTDPSDGKRDFFVSFNQADRVWATWIAWVLEEKGYSVFFQDWDFRGSFIEQMHQASLCAGHTLVVLSDNYLRSEYARSEAWAALARDPVGREDRVITVKVGLTGDLGLFTHFAYLDLTTAAETDAEHLLLERAKKSLDPAYRSKPETRPGFPGAPTRHVAEKPRFPGPIHNLPPRNTDFVGREEELGKLLDLLVADEPVVLNQAITGLGGIGKTQTALAYAYQHLADCRLVWWLKAEQPITLAADYAAMAEPLGLPETTDQPKQVEAVRRALESIDGWLLVFDNVEDQTSVQQDYFPRRGDGRVLLTSRRIDWRGIARTLPIDVLPEADAVALLLGTTEVNAGASTEAAALAKELGYLPLALTQAQAYVTGTGRSFADYRALLAVRRKDLLRRGVPNDYKLPVLLTWESSLEAAEKACPAARPLLDLLAFFAADPLPRTMLATAPEVLPEPLRDPLALDDAIAALTRFSLVTAAAQGTLIVHRLVQAVVRDRLAPDLAAVRAECAIRLAAVGWPNDMWDHEGWSAVQALLPHALAAATHAPKVAITGYVLDRMATYLQRRGAYGEAAPLFEQAVATGEKTLGPEHPDLATRLNNLALLYQATGRYAEAEPLFNRALAIDEKTLGPEHPDLATRLNNLAGLYRATGRYAEAEPLLKRALAIDEKTLGPEHPDLAIQLNNLAGLYRDTGRYAEAEPLLKRALAILDKSLPREHPNLTVVRDNYALVLAWLGRGDEAAAIRQRRR